MLIKALLLKIQLEKLQTFVNNNPIHSTIFLTTSEGAWYIISVLSVSRSVSLSVYVCLSGDNFRKPWRRQFIFAYPVYLHGIRVEFVYEGHRVKVIGAKRPTIPIPAQTLLVNNSGSIKQPWSLRVAWISAMADRMVCPPSLSRGRKWVYT